MTNEAVTIELTGTSKGNPVRFDCADETGIEKGTLLWFSTPYLVSGAACEAKPFAGIAATEKVANDGQTTIGVYTSGLFDLKSANEAITAGSLVVLSGANLIGTALAANILTGAIVGKAVETGAANEVIKVAVGIY